MGLPKTLNYWLTPLQMIDPDPGSLTFIVSQIRDSFLGSAHEKKNLYVRALSVLRPSLLTSKNSDGLRLFVAPPLANRVVRQQTGSPCQV
jgi:hypothetical protein